MLGQTFSRQMVVLNYRLHKTYIAGNLCENRDKPAMKCEGKCYLCKRLTKEDKKDQENPERRAENKFESIPSLWGFVLMAPAVHLTVVQYPRLAEDIYNSFTLRFFHPPQC
jgi:hypothetical protein